MAGEDGFQTVLPSFLPYFLDAGAFGTTVLEADQT
jgi:hypothetical protein